MQSESSKTDFYLPRFIGIADNQFCFMNIFRFKKLTLVLIIVLFSCYGVNDVFSQTPQTNQSSLYVPLIGISSVPDPLSLPKGPGNVVYHYAVKNFLTEYPVSDVQVTDNNCSPVKFVEGDDDSDGKLDYSETWRYVCVTKLVQTTQSIATAIGTANGLPAAHKAYVTVVVGSDGPVPLVNIINITKVAYPLTLPVNGGDITFTYRVNNPGVVSLSNVAVVDDKCGAMSGKLGDTNSNNLLDITEVWVYTCTTHLKETTTNTVSVEAYAGGLKAVGYATITVTVALPSPGLPDTGKDYNLKIIVWEILTGVLAVLVLFLFLTPKRKRRKKV